MHPEHLLPRTGYLKNEIPIAGCAHQAGTVRFGTDPATSVAGCQLQGPRAGQPVRRRYQLLSEHRRGEPRADSDGKCAAGGRPPARTAQLSHQPTVERHEEDRMSLQGKAAIVTGSDSGIGRAIALELARQGAAVTINYHKNEDAALATKKRDRGRRRQGPDHPGRRLERRGHPEAGRRHRGRLRTARHPRQQRGDGDADLHPRDDRAPVRPGHRHRPQERLLRRPARRQADDRPGRRRPDHQHQLDPRGLADAGQRALLSAPRAASGC